MSRLKKYIAIPICLILMISMFLTACSPDQLMGSSSEAASEAASAAPESAAQENEITPEERVDQLMANMTLEEKIAQMMMPAIRTWEGKDNPVTDLSQAPALEEALRAHQYGGIILYGSNIVNTEQTVRLISDLQVNNANSDDAKKTGVIPYLIAADQEGGTVFRLTMSTRGTGSMAVGASGDNAAKNAQDIGRVFGEELSALGINVNLAPCLDVITDMADPGMSTRVYSDDPDTVIQLGMAFASGVNESNVITCYKYFPGTGDGSGYPTANDITLEDLQAYGLKTYGAAIGQGADMVMTSAMTFPEIDDEIVMSDGETAGYYPATLSPKIVTGMLRTDMGYDGVVITDVLETDQFVTAPSDTEDDLQSYFAGGKGSAEHVLAVSQKAVNAGCDILLIPTDLKDANAAQFYENLIAGLAGYVGEGAISADRIDQSVRRILLMKARHGILDMDTSGKDVDQKVEEAKQIVGSFDHHKVSIKTAQQAVTLLKNDEALPVAGSDNYIVILGRSDIDNKAITYALAHMMQVGTIDANARIENHISNQTSGPIDAATTIVIDTYYDRITGVCEFSEELSDAINEANSVICISSVSAGIEQLYDDNPAIEGVSQALSEAHRAGDDFILLSDNLPVDAARFQDADGIVCTYHSGGTSIHPTALYAIFGESGMPGRLPVDIPVLVKERRGTWTYTDEILYERGYSAAQ